MALFICARFGFNGERDDVDRPARDRDDGSGFSCTCDGSRERTRTGFRGVAILVQFAIVNVLLLTATFQAVVNYVQFSLSALLRCTVLGVFVLRWRQPALPRPYRTWGYPVTPIIFLAISVWMLWHMLAEETTREPSLWGLATVALGLVVYFIAGKMGGRDRRARR